VQVELIHFLPKEKKKIIYLSRFIAERLTMFYLEVRSTRIGFYKREETLVNFLHDNNIGAVITDTAGRRDCAPHASTIPKAFIRYVGNSLHPTDLQDQMPG